MGRAQGQVLGPGGLGAAVLQERACHSVPTLARSPEGQSERPQSSGGFEAGWRDHMNTQEATGECTEQCLLPVGLEGSAWR